MSQTIGNIQVSKTGPCSAEVLLVGFTYVFLLEDTLNKLTDEQGNPLKEFCGHFKDPNSEQVRVTIQVRPGHCVAEVLKLAFTKMLNDFQTMKNVYTLRQREAQPQSKNQAENVEMLHPAAA